jgi:signal transduction histidine kinase
MYKIAVELSKSLDEAKLLEAILSNSANLVEAQSGCMILASGARLKQAANFNYSGGLDLNLEDTPISWINSNKKPLIINNFNSTSYKGYGKLAGIKSLLAVPLIQRDHSLGVLCVFDKKGGFSRTDCQNLITLAHQATVTLLNARVHEGEKRTVAKLKEIDKMKADFVASVSHELRNPLTTIKGYLDLLSEGEGGSVSKEQLGFLNIIDESSGRLLNLINDLLTVSKIESATLRVNKKLLSLNDVFEKVAKVMIPEAKNKGLKLEVTLDKDLPLVEADPDRLDQVLINLVSNAIKFTLQGGLIEISSSVKNGALLASVKDSGPGVSEMDKKRLFDKFFRSQQAITQNVKGTGLGLAIAKGIVEQHHGKIWLESELGKGSTFYFSLPIKKKKAA